MAYSEVPDVPRNVNLPPPRDFHALLLEQPQRDVLVEPLDLRVPLPVIQALPHRLLLLREERPVPAQHELPAPFPVDVREAHPPRDAELGAARLEHAPHPAVVLDHDTVGDTRGAVVRVVALAAEGAHQAPVLRGHRHGLVRVDGVGLEVAGEGAQEELVEDTALLDGEVVRGLGVAPVGEVLGVVVGLFAFSRRARCAVSLVLWLCSFFLTFGIPWGYAGVALAE